MKCAIFEEHSSSCVVYSRFRGTLFPVSMIDGAGENLKKSYSIFFELLPIVNLGIENL